MSRHNKVHVLNRDNYNACEELDAAIFSGDRFHDEEAHTLMVEYVDRWKRELDIIKENNFYIEKGE